MPGKFENNANSEEKEEKEKLPERPLECTDCKKPISTHYTEIVGQNIIKNCMCSDCPVLERHLFGLRGKSKAGQQINEATTGLACGNCGTTLDALRMGAPLGCSACYEVFEEMIITELLILEKIPPRLATAKKSESLHIGRILGSTQEISSSMRLLALNEALNETLKREDYEQAALLRDQIKALTETETKEKEKKEAEEKADQGKNGEKKEKQDGE